MMMLTIFLNRVPKGAAAPREGFVAMVLMAYYRGEMIWKAYTHYNLCNNHLLIYILWNEYCANWSVWMLFLSFNKSFGEQFFFFLGHNVEVKNDSQHVAGSWCCSGPAAPPDECASQTPRTTGSDRDAPLCQGSAADTQIKIELIM